MWPFGPADATAEVTYETGWTVDVVVAPGEEPTAVGVPGARSVGVDGDEVGTADVNPASAIDGPSDTGADSIDTGGVAGGCAWGFA